MNTETRICQSCKNQFVIEPDDFTFYERMRVPLPTWCPECRFQRRLAFANDRGLFKRRCDMCGKSMISSYPPEQELIVYCNVCWWSDKWDSGQYAREYDPSRPFLEQLRDLIRETPQVALDSNYPTLVNSEYVNHCATAKNCYLIFTADECENVLYSEYLLHNKDLMDSTMTGGSELCYGLVNSGPCYRTFFSEDCEDCQETYFSKDCIGCSNCFGCVGLRKKNYCIFNKPYEKGEYKKKLEGFHVDSYKNVEHFKKESTEFWEKYPHKFSHALRNLNVTGDYIYESKNSKNMYVVHEGAENSRYCQLMTMTGIKDSYDYTIWGNGAQRIYEGMIVGEGADTIKCSFQAWPNVREIEYSLFVISSSYLFGCANMRNKRFCILNKQYSEEEYKKLRERIIHDMNEHPYVDSKGRVYKYGEFFPPEFSLSGYDESYAPSFFPLSKEEAEKRGFSWYEQRPNPHQPTVDTRDLPDSIHDIKDAILNEIIECMECKNPFRVVPNELLLLRRFELPIPRKCPNCRYAERCKRVNPPRLYRRTCQCGGEKREGDNYQNATEHFHGGGHCPNTFETSYAPDRPEIVYCEQCYNSEIA